MTFAELERAFKSKERVSKVEQQRQASFDYILADLMGRSISRLYNSSNKLPAIHEVYPSLFNSQEIEQEIQVKRNDLSILRLKQFAQFHNSKFKGGAKIDE